SNAGPRCVESGNGYGLVVSVTALHETRVLGGCGFEHGEIELNAAPKRLDMAQVLQQLRGAPCGWDKVFRCHPWPGSLKRLRVRHASRQACWHKCRIQAEFAGERQCLSEQHERSAHQSLVDRLHGLPRSDVADTG